MQPERQFFKIAEAITALDTRTQELAATTDVFGRGGAGMLRMLNLGTEGFKSFHAEAKRLGLLLTDEELKKINAANDELDRFANLRQGVTRGALGEVGGAAAGLAGGLTKLGELLGPQQIGRELGRQLTLGPLAVPAEAIRQLQRGRQMLDEGIRIVFPMQGQDVLKKIEKNTREPAVIVVKESDI